MSGYVDAHHSSGREKMGIRKVSFNYLPLLNRKVQNPIPQTQGKKLSFMYKMHDLGEYRVPVLCQTLLSENQTRPPARQGGGGGEPR